MAMLPICDNCSLAEEQSIEVKEGKNISTLKRVIIFPQRKK
jgi:hypothetical protein